MHSPKKVIFLSWRDPFNPKSGGAETVQLEVFNRLTTEGWEITWFSAGFENSNAYEVIDGITYIRKGNYFTVHSKAMEFLEINSDAYDIVIDEVHGFHFMTNLYLNRPTLTSVCEVAGPIWFKMWKMPISLIGYFFEKGIYFTLKNQPIMANSPSTKLNVQKQGIRKDNIDILTLGVNSERVKNLNIKKKKNQICFVGGIRKMKGVDVILKAHASVVKEIPDAKLILVGKMDPSFEEEVNKIINENKLQNNVEITGFVSNEERDKIMKESEYLVSGSINEGFGLIVVEAYGMGTPAITFDVNAYRDIVKNNETGFLVENYSDLDMASQIKNALKLDKEEYKRLQKNAWEFSKQFNWDNTAEEYKSIVENAISDFEKRPSRFSAKFSIIPQCTFAMVRFAGNLFSKLGVVPKQ